MMYDVIIIGSGPAGLSAAIYGERAMLKLVVLESQPLSGGQILNAHIVDNYPGLLGVGGFELGDKLRKHAEEMGASFVVADVKSIGKTDEGYDVCTEDGETYHTKTVILSTGAAYRKLGVPGEEEHIGMGVSYCATCDGAFFRNKTVAVVGGGDVALGDAVFLSRICTKVYLIHRRDEFRGAKYLQESVFNKENIEIIYNSEVKAINGTDKVESIQVYNNKEDKEYPLTVDGIFIAVGLLPISDYAKDLVETDEAGYVIADEDGKTNHAGIFVAGDVRTKQLRQVVTAVSDGANAITSVEFYLTENHLH